MKGWKLRVNEDITALKVAVIGADGPPKPMLTSEALRLAREQGLDLVEVNPGASPPVCKIIDRREFEYEALKARARARREPVEFEIRDNQIKEKL